VVTPEKMANFYEKIKLANEMYPWAGKRGDTRKPVRGG
jgi:hypothetical protein